MYVCSQNKSQLDSVENYQYQSLLKRFDTPLAGSKFSFCSCPEACHEHTLEIFRYVEILHVALNGF